MHKQIDWWTLPPPHQDTRETLTQRHAHVPRCAHTDTDRVSKEAAWRPRDVELQGPRRGVLLCRSGARLREMKERESGSQQQCLAGLEPHER